MSFSTVCCNNLLTPYNPFANANSFQCCNLLVPYIPSVSGGSSGPVTCAQVNCSSYTPVCFTTSGSNLCEYLAGIDTAICALQTAQVNIPCSAITFPPNYFDGKCAYEPGVIHTLCDWANDVQLNFCTIFSNIYAEADVEGNPQQAVTNNTVTDGNNGTLTVTTGLTGTNGTLTTTTNPTHGTNVASVQITPTAAPASVSVNTTTNIPVKAGNIYTLKSFAYTGSVQTGVLGSIVVNGTGTQKIISTANLDPASEWLTMQTYYIPDVNQNITISLTASGGTITAPVNFADLVMEPGNATNAGAWYEFQTPAFIDIAETYNNIASNFAVSLAYSASGLAVTLGTDVIVMGGKTMYTYQQTLTLTANTTTYVYYDTWNDVYIQKSSNYLDSTQILLYTLVTNSGSVTSKTVDALSAPYSGSNIQPLSITGANIAAATITSAKLANTTVSAGNYGDSTAATHISYITVNAQGQITAASTVAIAYPVTSVNGATGTVSLGLGDLNNVVLTSPSNGQFLQYNGTNWVNTTSFVAYYQTMKANGTSQTQRSFLNFSAAFTLSDSSVNDWTLVTIANNGVTYGMMQATTGGNVLLGNSTGSSGAISEQTVSNSLNLSGGVLDINFVINKQTVQNYDAVVGDITGTTYIFMAGVFSSARSVVLPAASTVPVGKNVYIKDTAGNAGTYNINVSVSGGGNIDGSSSIPISNNYNVYAFVSDGTQWWLL